MDTLKHSMSRLMYENGEGEQDFPEALRWFRKAAIKDISKLSIIWNYV